MPQNARGQRVGTSYPRLGPLATQAVKLEQPEREKPPKASNIPVYLQGWKGWSKDVR